MKTQLSLLMGLFMISLGFSQTGLWTPVANKSGISVIETKSSLPNKTLFNIDMLAMKKALQGAKGKSSGVSNTIIQFPNTQGKMESYRITETPVLAYEMSLKYSDIKSYTGQGINNPEDVIKISLSDAKGLQTMRLSKGSAVFIEPISKDLNTLTVYEKSENSATLKTLQCMVDDKTPSFTGGSSTKNANDSTLRTYRLAVSTNGEYTQFHGGTKAGAMAAINTTMTRVNGVFENDFAVTMVVIANNDAVVYTNANTDPYSNGGFNSQLQSTLTSVIGEANYDIGHLFAKAGDNGNAGCIGCVCVNGSKGSGFTSRGTPEGDPFDIDYVAHEIGHQFGANHTFSIRNESTNAHFEPGSGTTIMGYAGITGATDVQQNSDPYFHFFSIEQVTNYIKTTSCQTNTNTGNAIPTANAGSDYTVPSGTAFVLTGQASDANGDALTYCWEQRDENNAATTYPSVTATSGVAFRSYNPTTSNQRYFPRLETIKTGATSWQWEAVPDVTRALNFRLTVRDNRAGGAGNNSDDMRVNVTANAGPFVVNVPNTNVSWPANSVQTVTWNVAGTTGNGINAANVDILLSTDGGNTYTTTLATAVTNDGSHNITVPNVQGAQNRIMVKGSGNIFFDISNTNFEISGVATPDTEAPSTPSGLTASNTTSNSVGLSWNASTDNIGVSGYDVYQGNTVVNTVTGTSYTVTGLTPETAYSFRVKAKDAAGNESGFSTTVSTTTLATPPNTGCTGGITSFPYSQGFENTLGGWAQATSGDDINWTNDANGTPSRNTGPSSAAQGSYYMYIEASGNGSGYPNKRAILNSPCFDLSAATQATFSFKYHMYGTSMGTLTLEASNDDGATWTSVWTQSGNQGNAWESVAVDLASYTGLGVQLRFNGITSTSWSGDMAFDDISLTTGSIIPPQCIDVDLSITLDNYPEETSWQITNSNNQVVASGGTYGSQPDGSTVNLTECLEVGTYTFTISDSFGDGICCQYGNGSYSLISTGVTLASGGSFGGSESTTFTLGNASRGATVDSFETTKAFEMSTYPNPVQDILNIASTKNIESVKVQDMLGRTILQGKVTNKSIDFRGFDSGLYMVTIKLEGNKSKVFRVINK